jgi:hypothetical protein
LRECSWLSLASVSLVPTDEDRTDSAVVSAQSQPASPIPFTVKARRCAPTSFASKAQPHPRQPGNPQSSASAVSSENLPPQARWIWRKRSGHQYQRCHNWHRERRGSRESQAAKASISSRTRSRRVVCGHEIATRRPSRT